MAYFTASSVANIDTVLTNIASFIATLTNWTVDLTPTAPATIGTNANGLEFIARNGAVCVGLRSIRLGNHANELLLYDGINGGSAVTVFTSIPNHSGLLSTYTTSNISSGLSGGGTYINVRRLMSNSTNVTNPGPYPNMWCFSNDNVGGVTKSYVHVVLQIDSVTYSHMLFGNLTQFGTWSNTALGGYFAGTFWDMSGYVSHIPPTIGPSYVQNTAPMQVGTNTDTGWLDFSASFTPTRSPSATSLWLRPVASASNYLSSGVAVSQGQGSVRGGQGRIFKNMAVSQFSNLVPMSPVVVLSENDGVSPATICPVGLVPDFCEINMSNFVGAQEFAIGSDTWKVFPWFQKNGAIVNSGSCGFAYKKIP